MSSTFQTKCQDKTKSTSIHMPTLLSVQIFFSRFSNLWNSHIQSASTASTGFYLILVLRSSPFKVGGYCHNHKECPSSIWCCGNSNLGPSWGQLSTPYFMANLAPSGALWHFGHITIPCPFMASSHIRPSLASLANSHTLNPQASVLVFGPGGSESPSHHHCVWTTPFH
ncbi:hypothetical protein O181_077894 [Austropuccinia psidii MF-1]|uniref:Uncharacterized protein n=1 Tax=Austropuccinia psidii MF-1 TaxID=1389203 RepID=A0A9Q3IGS5_9BASI|nr:hypothetical protein [Austropuccinia psidii MF-1]